MNLSNNALTVVMNYSTCEDLKLLKEHNGKIMKAIKSAVEDLSSKKNYYFNLVALARTDPDNKTRIDKIKVDIGVNNFNKELANLDGSSSEWYHGFNSGMLAATRLYGDLVDYEDGVFENEEGVDEIYPVEDKWDQAKNDFPFLDT